jgi:multisubunit Na+/H+ antiporter MnhC subunit
METRVSYHTSAKALLILASACAFFAIFATIDTSEHYRAWRTARRWTAEQQSVAPAQDADAMHVLILTALAIDTAIIAVAFACGLLLGVSLATENAGTFTAAKGLGWLAIGLGLAYSAIMIAYQMKVGPRTVLKGPVYDYDLSMQIPILLAVGGYPLSFILYLARSLKKRRNG